MIDWQPIDTAPKDGTQVLLYFPSGSMQVGQWDDSPGFPPAFMNVPEPTHWAKLEPPR